MFALGQKWTSWLADEMSALLPKADIGPELRDVRFVPKADIRRPTQSDPSSEPNLRFAAVQLFKRVQHPTGLAPKGRFIASEAIEREIG